MAPVRCAGGAAVDPAYWCFQLLGAGTLLPWNVLITAADWWEARFPVSGPAVQGPALCLVGRSFGRSSVWRLLESHAGPATPSLHAASPSP